LGRVIKARPCGKTASLSAASVNASVATVGAYPTVGFLPAFHAPLSTQTALDQPPKPTCNHVGARPCTTRFIDSKGHSRFVLRILIILSHRSPKPALAGLPCMWLEPSSHTSQKPRCMRHPGTGQSLASSLEAADETREGRKCH